MKLALGLALGVAVLVTVITLMIIYIPKETSSTGEPPITEWKIFKDYRFASQMDVDSFLKDFNFNLKDYNETQVKYTADSSLVTYESNQLVIKPGKTTTDGCTDTTNGNVCIEGTKLVSKFSLVPNRVIAFRVSSIPGNWSKPGTTPSWPAIWLANSTGTWGKDAGEIDIYESVNGEAQGARTTQHTPPKCIMNGSVLGKSVLKQDNCNAGSSPSFPGEGCGIEMIDTTSSQNGTFACMWLVDEKAKTGGLEFFYWKHEDKTVYDLTGVFGKFPDPTKWGQNKYGNFTMSPSLCSYDHFSSFNLIINNSYCGQWSGVAYNGGPSACKKALEKIDKSMLVWRFDNIVILKKGEDINVPLYEQPSGNELLHIW